jgi:hypothetical protein
LVGLVLFWTLPGALAGEARAQLTVAASVASYARLEKTAPVPTFRVTAADLARGYVDIDGGYQLTTNDRERVVLQAHPRLGLARAVEIAGLRAALRVIDQSVEMLAPPVGEFRLRFRVWLAPQARTGEYPWPVQMAVTII